MGSKFENLLEDGSGNVIQSFFDSFLKTQADFRKKSGFKMVVIRESIGKCCDWCQARVGEHEYKSNSMDLFGRHKNCTCVVITRTERGTYQDVWSRKEYDNQRDARIAREKDILKKQSHEGIKIDSGKNVTLEYIKNSKPGTLTIGEEYDIEDHKDEVNFAKWLKDRLGGNIKVLKEINKDGIKTPDYLWNGKLWDLKTVSSEKAANSAIRAGLDQIKENPGGVMLDFGSYQVDEMILSEVIKKRMKWHPNAKVDILIKSADRFTVIRFQ